MNAGNADGPGVCIQAIAQRSPDRADSPARIRSRFEHEDAPAGLSKKIRRSQAGETSSDDDDRPGTFVGSGLCKGVQRRRGRKRGKPEEASTIDALWTVSDYCGHCASALKLMMG